MRKVFLILLFLGGFLMVNHHNFAYAAGPTFPEAVGDRYYTQDLARDYWSKIDDAGRKVAGGYTAFPVLIKDSNVTKGTLYTDIDIPVARGIVKYEVDVPNSYAALPPTVTQEDIYCRIETTAQTDFDISLTANLDGVTTNYVKVTYNETNGSSRARAKKAGTYVYEKAVSFTITVDDVAPTDYDLVLATLVGDGATTLIIDSYPRTASYSDGYDYIVSTQEDFNILIDYTAANQYRIKDDVKSIFVKFLSGGYQMTGATSPLQEGDSWGYIETNACVNIQFESGAYINMGNERGYIEINTEGCYLNNVSIRGLNTVASAIAQSFLLNADYVTFSNCNTQDRLSNTLCVLFRGSGTSSHNETATISNCKIIDVSTTSNSIYGFYLINNINGCLLDNMSSVLGNSVAFWDLKNVNNSKIINISAGNVSTIANGCTNISNIYMENVSSDSITGLNGCDNINNVQMKTISAVSGGAVGATSCENINNIRIETMSSTFTNYGVYNCDRVSNCYIKTLDGSNNTYAYYQCEQLTNCYAEDIDSSGGNAYGFYDCDNLSTCVAMTCDYGFYDCIYFASCTADTNSIDGFYNCDRGSASKSTSNTGNGYNGCDQLSSCSSLANGADGYNDCDMAMGCRAVNNTGDGFQDCNLIEHNYSTGSGGVAYNNCFADLGATRAAAATDAGGENS